ncbi:MAG TPA: PhoU domain-containing protein [Ktedonobacterales bacterium]|nr:PhoU domain-containing protein [Ktedonobacterales bacterium]
MTHTESDHELAATELVAGLLDEVTELGLMAEDVFKNASAALLFPQEAQAAHVAMEHEQQCAQLYRSLHQRSLGLLRRSTRSSAALRRIVEVQQIAAEFARIADDSRQIAEHALWLGGMADTHLIQAGGDAPLLLVQLVRQAYVEIRGSVVATATHDTVLAKRLLSEDGELDQLFLSFKANVERALAVNPRSGADFNRLLLIAVILEDIGNRVASTCNTILYSISSGPLA